MNKFWKFKTIKNKAETEEEEEILENVLVLNGAIADESWWGDEVTPAMFKDELSNYKGDLTVWINSPGGDVRSDRA